MKELKCPNCGQVFQVNEADYASIVSQVKNAEFNAEVDRRLAELHERHKAEQELATAKTEQSFLKKLNDKELELKNKDAEISRLESSAKSELDKVMCSYGMRICATGSFERAIQMMVPM